MSSSISWLTAVVSRAYLSRCRLASKSSSAKPSSICYGEQRLINHVLQRTCTYLGERILLISIFVSKLQGISYNDFVTEFTGNHSAYPRLVRQPGVELQSLNRVFKRCDAQTNTQLVRLAASHNLRRKDTHRIRLAFQIHHRNPHHHPQHTC